MALKAGYVGVKRWLYEKLQATTSKNVQDIADIWADNNITGVKNFLALPIKAVKATNQTGSWADNVYTINGGTFTFNVVGDLITDVVINGTFTADTTVATNAFNDNVKVAVDGDYIPSGVSGGSASTYSIIFNYKETLAGSEKGLITLYNDGNTVKTIDADWLLKLYLVAKAGTYNNVSLKPMIRLATDPDATYAPFAMTNRQLTTDKVSKTLVSTDTAATIFSESTKVSTCTAILNDLLVSLRLTSTSGAATSGAWTTIATLNEAYRPAGLVYEAAIDDAGNPFGWVRIHSDTGKVEVYHGAGSTKTVNISSLYLRNTSAAVNRSLDAAPDTRGASPEVIADDPEPVTKTTRKSTKKEDN